MKAELRRKLSKSVEAHKFDHGHALVLTGGAGQTGAARLAARGALRVGAGLVTLGVPGAALLECAMQSTAVMCRRCDGAEGLASLLEDARINALCMGPGMGVERATDLLGAALSIERFTVLDADALTALARDRVLFSQLHARCVLTPHGGEFARLFPKIVAAGGTKAEMVRHAAEEARCVILYKGAETVIAAPDARVVTHHATGDRAAPWLATAGSGDVLAGFIAGLVARGFEPMDAAEAATWLHADCAREFGPGLIAEDLPEMLPQVFRKLGF